MAASTEKAKNKNWLKLAIIPVLLGVLGIVVWRNQGPTAVAPAPLATSPAASSPAPSIANSFSQKAKPKRVAWPKFTHEQILRTNPFRGSSAMLAVLKPAAEAPAAATASHEAEQPHISGPDEEMNFDPWAALLEEFPAASKGIYIESSKGPALKVGSRLLQVGDRIGQNYRITEVRPDGIVVETAPAMK